MGVSVDFKPRYRWLRSQKAPSLLGGGLLERVRSTSLALLGVTTAVGLAMVALALNQSWPLLADSPVPVAPPRHEAVGEATIAAQAFARATGAGRARLDGSAASAAGRAGNGDGDDAPRPGSDFAPVSAELVVAPSAPVETRGDAPRGGGDPASPTGKPPREPENTVPASAPAPPEPAPQPPPTVETTPAASSAEVPVASSNDEGDDDDWDDDDGDWDDDDDDWHGRDHGYGHGHRWSRGHGDD